MTSILCALEACSAESDPNNFITRTRLSSPAYSICSDGEPIRNYDSTSSIDGSSRPGSDRFCLRGEFSSEDEPDDIVSGTDSSDHKVNSTESLAKLKTLNKKQGKRKPIQKQDPVIVISDSSSDDEFPPPSSLFSPLNPSTLSSDNSTTLIVRIPLNGLQISRNTKRSPVKLALSHFATSKRKRRLSSSSDDDPISCPVYTPISLKLRKSSDSNTWHTVDNDNIYNSNNSDNSSSDNCEEQQSSRNSVATENSTDKEESRDQLSNDTKPTDPIIVCGSSSDPVEPISCEPISINLSSNDDTDLVINEDNDSTSTYSQSTSTSTSESTLQSTTLNLGSNETRNSSHSFAFEQVFSRVSPKLGVVRGDLFPIVSLSIKGLTNVVADHPIHNWKLGKPVKGTKKFKRRERIKVAIASKELPL